MNLKVYLKNGTVLEFLERVESTCDIEDRFSRAASVSKPMRLTCTNGIFLLNPLEILYMTINADEQEPDVENDGKS